MPYKKDRLDKIIFKKIEGFWHPVKQDGSISKIKGHTKQKALNALHAYEAIAHSDKKDQ